MKAPKRRISYASKMVRVFEIKVTLLSIEVIGCVWFVFVE